jgi:HlyD family secretion protein
MLNRHAKSLLLVFAGVAAGTLVSRFPTVPSNHVNSPSDSQSALSLPASDWVAAGPGRVEPHSGEIRISASVTGRIDGVFVRPHDKVVKGALLAVIDDGEYLARVKAAEAEVAFRESERETAVSGSIPNERRSAEDSVAHAERAMRRAQAKLDHLSTKGSPVASIDAARTAFVASESLLAEKHRLLDVVLAAPEAPRPNRTESALAVARAELGIALAVLEKTRIRAPWDGTLLQVSKSAGDAASAAIDDVLITMGDIDRLRIKVEIDENEIGNISTGQHAVIRTDAFPSANFKGTVSRMGASSRPRTLATPNTVSATKDNALEVIVDLDASTPLVPGMRVDAFFEPTNLADSKGDANGPK